MAGSAAVLLLCAFAPAWLLAGAFAGAVAWAIWTLAERLADVCWRLIRRPRRPRRVSELAPRAGVHQWAKCPSR